MKKNMKKNMKKKTKRFKLRHLENSEGDRRGGFEEGGNNKWWLPSERGIEDFLAMFLERMTDWNTAKQKLSWRE